MKDDKYFNYVKEGKLYKFRNNIVIALESERVISWKDEDYDIINSGMHDIVAVLINNEVSFANVMDLEEVK